MSAKNSIIKTDLYPYKNLEGLLPTIVCTNILILEAVYILSLPILPLPEGNIDRTLLSYSSLLHVTTIIHLFFYILNIETEDLKTSANKALVHLVNE